MAKQRVMVVGGGLAGLAAAMKLAEIGIDVDLMSLVPVKRSHSVCAQGGINSCNDVTRQQGDSEALRYAGSSRFDAGLPFRLRLPIILKPGGLER